ncbi:MAG TPA: hypothetical protein VF670_15515 [Duganella sp.]|jgi:hypothetical protein
MPARVPPRLVALVFFAALGCALGVYPLQPLQGSWLAPLLLAYTALLWWRPVLWLFALPALLPIVDLAPLTGWFFLEEIDLLLMVTAGVCYWHTDRAPSALPRWTPPFRYGLVLLAVACAIGLWRGLAPLAAPDVNAFNNYLSPYNALRVGKAWLWALILLPPLRRAAGPQLHGVYRLFVPGLLTGLFFVTCAAIGERLQFPGLLNFSSDYRITAPFSAMHTGGAALDGFLALTFPVLAMWLFGRASVARTAAALVLLPLALYAGLATFSRGLYLAYAVTATVLLCSALPGWVRHGGPGDAPGQRRPPPALPMLATALATALAAVLAVTLVLGLLNAVFTSSGYRGYGAALLVLAAMLLLSAQPLRPAMLTSGLLVGAALAALCAWLLPIGNPAYAVMKAPYLLFLGSALGFALAMLPALTGAARRGPISQPLAALAYAGLLLNAGWIALHTSGPSTLAPSGGLLALAMLPIVINLVLKRPLWRITPRRLTAVAAGMLVLAAIVPIYNGYFVEQRFSHTGGDLAKRLRHWGQGLDMMDKDPMTAMLGLGLGKFPVAYHWRNGDGEIPPSYRYVDRAGNRHLRLATGAQPAGYGEPLRIGQTVQVRPHTQYQLSVDVWHDGSPAFLHVELCERQLLYRRNCVPVPQRQLASGPYWQHIRHGLDTGTLGAGGAPVRLELAAHGQRVALDVDNVALRGGRDDHDLIRNGTFTDANNYWFFSSDHHHLPWHLKNLALNVYFEMGWPGVLAYWMLVFSAASTLLRRAVREKSMRAAAWFAAILSFQMVGLFDSLLDVPRITFLFMLVLCAAALQPVQTGAPRPAAIKAINAIKAIKAIKCGH